MRKKIEVKRKVADSEILGRELTKRLCEEHNWKFTESVGDETHYDCFIEMDNAHCIGEIKVRDVKFIRKPTLHFEVKKYNNLNVASQAEKTDKIFYINWLGNQCFMFEVNDDLISKSKKGLSFSNKVTARSREYENKVYKEMYFLPKYLAKRYTLKNFDEIYEEIVQKFNLKL